MGGGGVGERGCQIGEEGTKEIKEGFISRCECETSISYGLYKKQCHMEAGRRHISAWLL